jgi:outer membrane receptor protein involved in Fe transport
VWDLEFTDSVTKELGHHTLKTGVQVDDLEGDIMQPPAPRGLFTFNGQFTDIANQNQSLNGIADLLLTPTASTVGCVNNVGGLQSLSGSNFAGTQYHRYYTAAYFQDDWRVTPSPTLNLGLRWDYFTPYAGQTDGRPTSSPQAETDHQGPCSSHSRAATFHALQHSMRCSVQATSISIASQAKPSGTHRRPTSHQDSASPIG